MEEAKAYPSIPDLLSTKPALESTQKALANETKTVPNGGLKAWLQVLGTFFIFFNTW
jgi:hypothetical protein